MKRDIRQILKEVSQLAWRDIKEYKAVIISLTLYFIIVWSFFYTSCGLVLLTGYPCPACGITRASFSILRGNLVHAWILHPFAYVFLLLTLVAITRRYFLKQSIQNLKKWLIIIIVGLCVFYIYRIWRYFPGEPPMSYYNGNLLREIFMLYMSR